MSAQDPDIQYLRLVLEPKVPSKPDVQLTFSGSVQATMHAAPGVQVVLSFDDRVKTLQWIDAFRDEVRKFGPGGAGIV